jgi:outer membrane receptor protein involved in Fe transport
MRRRLSFFTTFLMANIISLFALSQSTTINGIVTNSGTGAGIPAVSVTVTGTDAGTFTDDKGNFTLTVNRKPPFTITVSSVGFETQEVTVSSAASLVPVELRPANVLGQEIVVSATRTPARIMESPVTIERVSAASIRNSPASNYYDIVGNLKGVDLVTSSLTFKTPSTRGFNGSGNLRLNQLMDNMDNQAPGLNFSVGSIIGLTELDVESMELLPGASSALYGPGGMNGALLINSKSAFKYQGLSFNAKTGIMHIDDRSRSPSDYYNWTLRWAKKVSEKFAFKIGTELIQATDWVADDYRNFRRIGTTGTVIPGDRQTDPNYDGINVYGDETTIDLRANVLNAIAVAAPFYAPYVNALPASMPVSRTGYQENEVLDPTTLNYKLTGALEYKLTPGLDLVLAGHWGTGTTVYTGSDRYSLKDLKVAQYKVELNHKNFFLRGYTTQENAGEAFNATITTRLFNEAWKPSGGPTGWYATYGQAFLAAKVAGQTDINAHNAARAAADVGRPKAGSEQFRRIFDQVRKVPISKGGGLFIDKTDLYVAEGQYDLSQHTSSFADIVIGGNFKYYSLNSEGTLFADSAGEIGINEVGGYIQATRNLMNDRLKLILSGRYDKNENFDGKFTPRVSAVIKVGEDKNVRLSYQSAYRFGSTQQQWINLRVAGGTRLLGGLQTFQQHYKFNTNPVYSIDANLFAGNPQQRTFEKFKAETLNSFEAGFKGLMMNKKLLIDIYGYYGVYSDFIARTLVAQSVNGDRSVFTNPATVQANLNNPALANTYSVPINVPGDVKTYGFGLSADYILPRNFSVNANFSSDKLQELPANFVAAFNAPLYRVAAGLSNTGFGPANRLSFNINWRWQDDVQFQGDFATGEVPAFHNVDAFIGYKFPKQKVLMKLAGTNILNQYYRNAIGNASVGGLYYVSIGYNLF